MTPGEARTRLQGLGLGGGAVDALMAHFEDAERRGKQGHGFQRVAWLETVGFEPSARPERLVAEEGFERWAGRGAGPGGRQHGICAALEGLEQVGDVRPGSIPAVVADGTIGFDRRIAVHAAVSYVWRFGRTRVVSAAARQND